MADFQLRTLTSKDEIDTAIRDTLDKVLLLRFGRASDFETMRQDDIVGNSPRFYQLTPLVSQSSKTNIKNGCNFLG